MGPSILEQADDVDVAVSRREAESLGSILARAEHAIIVCVFVLGREGGSAR